MLTVSGISSLKIVKFFNREQITTVHNHKRRYISLPCLWTAPKRTDAQDLWDSEQKIQKTTMTSETAEAIGPIVLCIARDQWRWTEEVVLTRSSWVPNRDAQTGIMHLFLEGGFRSGQHRGSQDK